MRRRRIIVGGFTMLAIGGAAYGTYKLATRDVQRIEQHTGKSADDLTEEELVAAMEDLGIKKIELTDDDKAEITKAQPATSASLDYDLDEIERLAELKDKGIISEEEFNAKKKQILGL